MSPSSVILAAALHPVLMNVIMHAVNNPVALSGTLDLLEFLVPATNMDFTTGPYLDGHLDQDIVDHIIVFFSYFFVLFLVIFNFRSSNK